MAASGGRKLVPEACFAQEAPVEKSAKALYLTDLLVTWSS